LCMQINIFAYIYFFKKIYVCVSVCMSVYMCVCLVRSFHVLVHGCIRKDECD